MAKKQTSRSTTLSRDLYQAAKSHCNATGEPLARLVDLALRRELEMPENGPARMLPIPLREEVVAKLEARAAELSIAPDQLLQHIVNRALDAERWPSHPPYPSPKTT